MTKRLTKTGNSVALVLDKPLLEAVGMDADSTVEVSTNGQMIVITPVRDPKRNARLKEISDEINRQYGGVFRRLAE